MVPVKSQETRKEKHVKKWKLADISLICACSENEVKTIQDTCASVNNE